MPSYCYRQEEDSVRQWKPLKQRSCTDVLWLLIFIVFCVGMAIICGFAIASGAARRLVYGYDSYGNICGHTNTKIEGVELSGHNLTDQKYVFFFEPCNWDLANMKVKSTALCVTSCPDMDLNTLTDVRNFAKNNGSRLCLYNLGLDKYIPKNKKFCPELPVRASKPIPFFHRCVPMDGGCTINIQALVTFVSYNSVLQRVITGVMTSKEIIVGLCLMSLVLSIVLMVIIRYISKVLVWIIAILTIIGSIGGTAVLWYFYADQKKSLQKEQHQNDVGEDNVKALLVSAIAATVVTVVLLLLMLIMRKRVALTIALFHVAGKVFTHIPLLIFQSLWTFIALALFWVYWIGVLFLLATAGYPEKKDSDYVEFKVSGPLQYTWIYHLVGLIWISEFILACQQMTIAGAVVTYYFTRDKNDLPAMPILSSMRRLIVYHLGTVAKGSFIITLIKIPRMILVYLHSQLKGKENAFAKCLLKACMCCLWCLEKCLLYLNRNAYIATAINGTSFCTSAKDALVILVENAMRVAAINTVGDFVLLLGKLLIVLVTGITGIILLNYQRDYTVWVLPLIIICLFAFFVSHCFLSIYEMVVDVLFLCFAVDCKHNDGSSGREYYMDKSLMEFMDESKKAMRSVSGNRTEMKSMASEAGSA
ncbi:choline transporter-like protein 1 isoform X2 [Hypanus sabinus]|uniref:choline transporter-like protein 1 isoform X2 n=2 Tax=Hypanus sabinus TaxID=79690 RepID=UPI0028C47501|nr:choline transporter-like protein 1 isoform X2 [Hypanus sabinus]